jgi:hypothetical protein
MSRGGANHHHHHHHHQGASISVPGSWGSIRSSSNMDGRSESFRNLMRLGSMRSFSLSVGGAAGEHEYGLGRSSRSLRRSKKQEENHQGGMSDEEALRWAALERLPTVQRMRTGVVIHHKDQPGGGRVDALDVTKIGPVERQMLLDNLLKVIKSDNDKFLLRLRKRLDK